MLEADGYSAQDISEMLLGVTGNALLSNDFDAFAGCFHVPHVIETPDKKTILKTTAALRAVFDQVVQDYADRHVTDLIRICDVAEFRGPFRVEATHITHMMSGSQRVLEPYPCYSVLEFIDDRWQATATQYAVDRTTNVGRALHTGLIDTKPLEQASGAAKSNRKDH